jgi:hypothetical protein
MSQIRWGPKIMPTLSRPHNALLALCLLGGIMVALAIETTLSSGYWPSSSSLPYAVLV